MSGTEVKEVGKVAEREEEGQLVQVSMLWLKNWQSCAEREKGMEWVEREA